METQEFDYENSPEFHALLAKRIAVADANPLGGISAEELH
jgi:hypothetical protein